MDEKITTILVIAGTVVMLLGLIWLIARAFGTSKLWGWLGLFFVVPVLVPIFTLFQFKRAFAPLVIVLLGAAIAGFGPIYNLSFPTTQDKSPGTAAKTNVSGGTEQSLTVGRRKDIEDLKADKTATRLQLNEKKLELTDDEVAEIIAGRENLIFIDLGDNPVTDATLEKLVKLPKLEKLYAPRTKMTADGVVKFILDNPDCKIKEIDFRGLNPAVPGKALRDWKAKDKDNRKFNN